MSTSRTSKQGLAYQASGRTKPLIPKKKVACFINLFTLIKEHLGTYTKAEDYCKISHNTTFKMRSELFLTNDSAKKILNSYNKLLKKI